MGMTTIPVAADYAAPPVPDLAALATPALFLFAERMDANVQTTLRLMDQDAGRWRPHVKTAKLLWAMRRLVAAGVRQAKCATTLELETACRAGFDDVIISYPVVGPHVEAVRALAQEFPAVRISTLVEATEMVPAWRGSHVGLFVDVNPGMDRTGAPDEAGAVLEIVRAIAAAGIEFRGLHFYDGPGTFAQGDAGRMVGAGYDRLLAVADAVSRAGFRPAEITTAGTSAFAAALSYRRFLDAGYVHRLTPGTLMYCDVRSLGEEVPPDAGYLPAVLVASRVVSHPLPHRITCDAGHKTVAADSGDPTCAVVGHPDWIPRHPSEEHLPIDLPEGSALPARGELLWLVPRHVCPSVNNFDHAVVVENGRVLGVEPVTARGRRRPLA
jgi:D-serine deaminase-like pyridoxal phosphate-dependent protein